ncbi:MAG: DUF1595 domain-containing protein, partial [Myxococcales bacterium]|nr:DUF1595 domain-containing protein [Myxococcales bacterium]
MSQGRPAGWVRAGLHLVAVAAAGAACSGGGDVPAPLEPSSSAAGSAAAAPAAASGPLRRLRRLSNREYDNVVRDLLGDESRPATRFLEDDYPNGYDNGSAALAVQSDQVSAYQAAAESLAATAVAGRLPALLGGCDVPSRGEEACAGALLDSFAARAFRRPLRAPERANLLGVFGAERAGTDFPRAVQTVVEVVLQSPQFLYREELGAGESASGRSTTLTDYEVASELSFLLTGTIPDDALWTAIGAGRFRTADDRVREA